MGRMLGFFESFLFFQIGRRPWAQLTYVCVFQSDINTPIKMSLIVVLDTHPTLPDTTSDSQRRRRRRSKRKRGFRSPPIEEAASEGEQPRGEGKGDDVAAAFRVSDLRSTVEMVCDSSEAERSAASCVTYVGVELRQRSWW